jgi:2',3'-cyclic-nucleotide 2'-phosphodiesterase (5'-nucleotidase family)
LLNLLPVLRQRSDLIVVLSHLGCSAADPIPLPGALRDVELASRLPEGAVQLIVGGHTHTILNERGLDPANLINGAAIVQAGSHAQYIGDVHIEVTPAGACVTAARLVPVDALPVDEAFDAAHVLPLARRVQALLQEPVGVSAQDPDLDPACARGAFAARESALANFVADALAARCRSAGLPVDLAMVDAPTLCDGLPQASPLTFGDLFRLSCYADSVVLIRLPVDDLQAFLDDNARRLDALDEPHEERGFVQFSRELRYRIPADAGGHAERRAIDITLNAEPLAQLLGRRREPLLIATTSFYRQFALPWELRARTRGLNILDSTSLAQLVTSLGVRDELVAFVRRAGGVTPAGGLLRDGRLRLDLNA